METTSPSMESNGFPPALASQIEAAYVSREKAKILQQPPPPLPKDVKIDLESYRTFSDHLKSSKRVLTLLGAGISVSSGVLTFSGVDAFWRNHVVRRLGSYGLLKKDPSLMWWFNVVKRKSALDAKPNQAHFTIAEFAKKMGDRMLTVCQNIDDLCPRAGQPDAHTMYMHGSLFKLKCTSETCTYTCHNTQEAIVPALEVTEKTSDPNYPLPQIPVESLPSCPRCSSLLRPGVTWFGEELDPTLMQRLKAWLGPLPPAQNGGEKLENNEDKDKDIKKDGNDEESIGEEKEKKIDLIIAIGTSATVYPIAGLIEDARKRGARVCIVNMDPDAANPTGGLKEGDWWFGGAAEAEFSELLQQTLKEMD